MNGPVANFHGIGQPGDHVDAAERPYWLSEVQFAEALALLRASRERVLLTFDDGNASDHALAMPMLRGGDLPVIVFACSDRIGQPGYLSAAQLAELAAQPGFAVGSHGRAHVPWRGLGGTALADELATSRKALEQACGARVLDAAIPFGRYDGGVLRAMAHAGYARAFSSDGGPRLSGQWPIPRLSFRGDRAMEDQVADLLARAAWHRRLAQEVRLRAKLVVRQGRRTA